MDEIKINKKTLFKGICILVISIFLIIALKNIFTNQDDKLVQGGTQGQNKIEIKDGVQIINLGVANYNYDPNTIKVKNNLPVKIIGNMKQLQGCLRAFVIPKLRISKLFSSSNNVLEFTPTQKGVFPFSCSMGMGTGTLIVE